MMKLTGAFAIATRETGVNGEAKFGGSLVLADKDVPAFDEEMAWSELVDVAILVHSARNEVQPESHTDHVDHILASLTKLGGKFFTDAMRDALGITDLNSGALAVKMDDPIDLWIAMDRHCRDVMLAKPAVTFQPDTGVNFIRGAGNMFDTVAPRAIQMALDCAFAVKWKHTVARPQEAVAAALADPSNAPEMFLQAVHPWVDEKSVSADPRSFTIYPEGCPPHPSYVAGHGAFSGAVYALLCVKYGLSKNKRVHDEVGQTLLSFAHCRSVAGVHYFQDNAQGFITGALAVKRGLVALGRDLGAPVAFEGDVNALCDAIDLGWLA